MANNNNAFKRNYGGIYPGTSKIAYLDLSDYELVNKFCERWEEDIGNVPDYVSSRVIPAIKESYRLQNLCVEAYLKNKDARETNKNLTIKENTQSSLWQSQDAWVRSISGGIAAIKASNEGTLGKRNIATSGLVMQQKNHNGAAIGPFHQAPGNVKGGKSRKNRMRKNRKSRRA